LKTASAVPVAAGLVALPVATRPKTE
jgi:hypothetical protein